MAKARRFKTGQYLREEILTATNISGAVSLAAYVTINAFSSNNNLNLISYHNSSGVATGYTLLVENEVLCLWNGSTQLNSKIPVKTGEGDVILGVTKASGSNKPVFYKYVVGTETWTVETHGTNQANSGTPGTTGTIRFNELQNLSGERGDVTYYAAAVWDAAKNEAEMKALAADALSEWAELGTTPKELWFFNQESTSEEVKGLIAGSKQTALSGSEVVESTQGIPYEAEAEPVSVTIEAPTAVATAEAVAPTVEATSEGEEEPEPEPEPEPETLTRLAVRELPRLDLHYEIETPSGRFYRWGKDEPKPENVPSGGAFSSTAPGGFDAIGVTLPRKPGVDYPDLERLSTVRAYGPGGELACEARLKEAPRVSGSQMSVSPVTEGWVAHLQDDTTAAEIYRDIDLGGWRGPSRTRLNELEAAGSPATGSFDTTVDTATGLPSLRLHIDGHWETVRPCIEVWYDAGPSCRVHWVYVDWAGVSDTNFGLLFFNSDFDSPVDDVSGDLYSATTGSGNQVFLTDRRYFGFSWAYSSTPAGIDGAEFYVDLRRLAVYGTHGLPLRGTEPEAGFLASDIVADAVGRWAPLLRFTEGTEGSIRPTSLAIPHLVFKEQTTPLAIIEGANAYEGRLYGVWDNRTFHYYDWGDVGRRWRARVGPSELQETGPSTERLRNGVIVQFRDVDGTTKTAGPVDSGCDFESAFLEDTDPENPANKRGIKRYGTPIDIGTSTSYNSAEIPIVVGFRILEALKQTDRSGTAKIVGYCEDANGVKRPAWQVRAGDLITFVDAAEPVERRIIRADYDEASLTTTITLDAPPDGVPALVAQLGVSIADLGI